ncbi:MAG: hypothetical protein QF704_10520 [Anaerolineales bacterium]|nr:hypothetical protein [Anaerolineales bacterium]
MKKIKVASIIVMSVFYVRIGADHFLSPEWYLQIVPPYLPFPLELVYISGFFEILFGLMLLHSYTRFYAGWGLIVLLLAVFPANIYLAQTNGAVLGTTSLVAWGRLPFQLLFVSIAYWHTRQ